MERNTNSKKNNSYNANNATFSQRKIHNVSHPANGSNSFQMNHTTQYTKAKSDNSTIPKVSPSLNQTVPLPSPSNPEFKKLTARIYDTIGNKPLTRFGNSFTLFSPVQAILFGGAVGNVKEYKFSNETFILNFITQIWTKLNFEQGTPLPSERAAHAAATTDNKQLVIHGGSIGGSKLAEDELWVLNLSRENNYSQSSLYKWNIINTLGKSPGKRYGHTLSFLKPYIILIGGNLNTQLSNDVWIIDINTSMPSWTMLDFPENIGPSPRLYHSCGIIPEGNNEGGILLFGGRDATDNPLNDIWELRKQKSGQWQWIMAPVVSPGRVQPRYNHSISFVGSLMIVLGGRGRNSHEYLPVTAYDTESREAWEFQLLSMYRQSSFIIGKNIFLYGGFNGNNPLVPLGDVTKIDMTELFETSPIMPKINKHIAITEGKQFSNITKINNTTNQGKKAENKREKFKLSYDVVVGSGGVNTGEEEYEDAASSFRRVAIDKLKEENKRISTAGRRIAAANSLLQSKRDFNQQLVSNFIDNLHRPFEWYEKEKMDELHKDLPFSNENIKSLLEEVIPILEKEKSLVRMRAPCKIFGNLYGEYFDLMRFFESFGNPSDDSQWGDISVMQYIFLGDFCDRCEYSLETILLLVALVFGVTLFLVLPTQFTSNCLE